MAWQAKPGCADHHRAAVERMVNALPAAWLHPPQSGEVFDNLEHCNERLRGYALAVYAEEERQTYNEPGRQAMGSTGQKIMELRDQMGVEEKARFTAQIEAITRPLIDIGERHLQLQKLPIGNPDPVPKRQFRKKKTHGKADARGLTGAELAQKTLLAEERAERSSSKRRATSPEVLGGGDDDNDVVTIPHTPPRPGPESQGGTAMTVIPLAIRLSPEHPRVATRPWVAPAPSSLFPREEDVAPPSTAPPDLQPRGRERKEEWKGGREQAGTKGKI
jgi:hypothetical protein